MFGGVWAFLFFFFVLVEKSRVFRVAFGFESGAEKTSRIMGNNVDVDAL